MSEKELFVNGIDIMKHKYARIYTLFVTRCSGCPNIEHIFPGRDFQEGESKALCKQTNTPIYDLDSIENHCPLSPVTFMDEIEVSRIEPLSGDTK